MTFLLTPVALLFPQTSSKKEEFSSDQELVPLRASSKSFSLECSESSDEDEVVFDMKKDVIKRRCRPCRKYFSMKSDYMFYFGVGKMCICTLIVSVKIFDNRRWCI